MTTVIVVHARITHGAAMIVILDGTYIVFFFSFFLSRALKPGEIPNITRPNVVLFLYCIFCFFPFTAYATLDPSPSRTLPRTDTVRSCYYDYETSAPRKFVSLKNVRPAGPTTSDRPALPLWRGKDDSARDYCDAKHRKPVCGSKMSLRFLKHGVRRKKTFCFAQNIARFSG